MSKRRCALSIYVIDTGANVLIAEPYDPVVDERVSKHDGLTLVAPTQDVVDLLTGSGRMPSEGEELLAWMKDNETIWRQ